jgi:hypothetical protein
MLVDINKNSCCTQSEYTLYRGLSFSDKKTLNKFLNSLERFDAYKVGDSFNIKIYDSLSSWSTDSNTARSFARGYAGVVLMIKASKDDVFADLHNFNPQEKEVILKPGKYKATLVFIYKSDMPYQGEIFSMKEWSLDSDSYRKNKLKD